MKEKYLRKILLCYNCIADYVFHSKKNHKVQQLSEKSRCWGRIPSEVCNNSLADFGCASSEF
jgi:hypothetical protein